MKVRTIFQPDREQEMPDDEAAVLRAQGLLVDDTAPNLAAPRPASTQTATVTSAPAKEGGSDGGK